jgi:hypothetical protein
MPTRDELITQFMLALAANASCINYLTLENPYSGMYDDLAEMIYSQAVALTDFALPL